MITLTPLQIAKEGLKEVTNAGRRGTLDVPFMPIIRHNHVLKMMTSCAKDVVEKLCH